MTTTVADIMGLMETIAPARMAHSHDKVGLHAGRPDAKVKRVLFALDASLPAIREAEQKKCQMLVVHHPRFYKPLDTLAETSPITELAAAVVRADIAVFCAHTNLDIADGGVNDVLADVAGLTQTRPLVVTGRDGWLKLVTFVPEPVMADVREAICDAGAGEYGEYTECTFQGLGFGTFRGSDNSHPAIGTPGVLEEVEEWRLEAILPESCRGAVESALREAHPYEEPAYDLIPLKSGGASFGCGRVGTLKKSCTLQALAQRMKKGCASTQTQILGDPKTKLTRVAVWSGGGCPVADVLRSGAEAIVCGELGYHDTETLQQAGICAITLGHGPSEEIILPILQRDFAEAFPELETFVTTAGTTRMKNV